jgi:hypothetical protein
MNSKIIVGRNENENKLISKYKNEDDYILSLPNIPAPTVILQGEKSSEALKFAADLLLYYSDSNDDTADVMVESVGLKVESGELIVESDRIKASVIDKESVDIHNIAIKR